MNILEKLVNNRENFEFKFLNSQAKNDSYYLYEYNKPCDYFILLVEGSFIVDCGQEKIESFAKSFEYFGTKSLIGKLI
jgi:metal transporter CNNM